MRTCIVIGALAVFSALGIAYLVRQELEEVRLAAKQKAAAADNSKSTKLLTYKTE